MKLEKRSRICGFGIAVLMLILGLVLPQTAAQAAGSSFLPELTDSSNLSTPVIARGRVLTSGGDPVAGGKVILYALPSQEDRARLQVGDTVKLQPVAKAVANKDAEYSLRIASLNQLAPMVSHDGVVNFRVITYGAGESTSFSFPRALSVVDGAPTLTAPGLDASSGSRSERAQAVAAMEIPEDAARTTLPEGASDVAAVEKSCSTTLQKTWDVWDLVGQVYHGVGGVPTTFTYSDSSYSELGVAVSASGEYGSFKAEGTQGQSSTGEVGYPEVTGDNDKYFYTKFRYGKFYQYCVTVSGYITRKYWVEPTKWIGGSDEATPASLPSTPQANCVDFLRGSTFTKNTTKSVTWTNGLNISNHIGLDLSTRTGYSSNAKVFFDFNESRNLCGTGDVPGGTPYQLVVRTLAFA